MEDLETERLIIRQFTPGDLDAIHRILDVELAEVDFGSEGAKTLAQRAVWLEWTSLSYGQLASLYQPPYGERAIELKATGELIGAIGYVPCLNQFEQLAAFSPSAASAPTPTFTPEFGLYYAISPSQQRRGYAAEAAQAMVDYAFGVLRLKRIVATTTYENEASMGVMRKLGMTIERNPFPDPHWLQVVGFLDNPGLARRP